MSAPEKDEISGVETTGHAWDGIKELNTPLPRWWLSIFYATVIWSIGYMIAYPAIPLFDDATKGLLGHSTRGAHLEDLEEKKAEQSKFRDQIAAASLEDILADGTLREFASKAGRAAYALHCSQCHGSGAAGGRGYPNLNDDAWIWGGSVDAIYATIKHGVRNEDSPEARFSEMPAFAELLSTEEIDGAANYVLKLASLDHDAGLAEAGATTYAENCATCHGDAGEGIADLGAPRLADAIWLYGDGGDIDRLRSQIKSQIKNPSHGVMPAWGLRLDDVTVKELAVYVYNLGGGQ